MRFDPDILAVLFFGAGMSILTTGTVIGVNSFEGGAHLLTGILFLLIAIYIHKAGKHILIFRQPLYQSRLVGPRRRTRLPSCILL